MDKTITLNFQPLVIVVPKEREHVYERLKHHFEKINKMLADPQRDEDSRCELYRILAIIARVMLSAVKDVQLDDLIKMLEAVEEKHERQKSQKPSETRNRKEESSPKT